MGNLLGRINGEAARAESKRPPKGAAFSVSAMQGQSTDEFARLTGAVSAGDPAGAGGDVFQSVFAKAERFFIGRPRCGDALV